MRHYITDYFTFTQSSVCVMELEDDSPPPSSPRLDRLSMRSDSPETGDTGQGAGEDKVRLVITSLLAAALQHDAEVRSE